jgi:L-aspartate oxidase
MHVGLVIIGSGIAGLSAAIRAREEGINNVVVVTRDLRGGSSWKAQGGIAVPIDNSDVESHVNDTLVAGRYLNDEWVVWGYIGFARESLNWLVKHGFEPCARRSLEGGHSRARVVRARIGGDRIGEAVMSILTKVIEDLGIRVVEGGLGSIEVDGGRVTGVVLEDGDFIRADAIILATGGYSGLYLYSTNDGDGSGIEAALRAGALVRDLEFVQFHPTVAMIDGDLFLVSEAVRGEGAKLVNKDGEYFMSKYDERAELAPRDVVSRAVYTELMRTGGVYLDASSIENFEEKFPAISSFLRAHGFKPGKDLIPITPAAHYAIGGVAVDALGRSSVRGLFAIGEASSTLFHGANRLASNSLLEALVQGYLAVRAFKAYVNGGVWAQPAIGKYDVIVDVKCRGMGDANISLVKDLMWRNVGIIRSEEGLRRAIDELEGSLLPSLIARAAMVRRESVGAHYRVDYPNWSGTKFHILFRCGDAP